jgi:hypothetical protein
MKYCLFFFLTQIASLFAMPVDQSFDQQNDDVLSFIDKSCDVLVIDSPITGDPLLQDVIDIEAMSAVKLPQEMLELCGEELGTTLLSLNAHLAKKIEESHKFILEHSGLEDLFAELERHKSYLVEFNVNFFTQPLKSILMLGLKPLLLLSIERRKVDLEKIRSELQNFTFHAESVAQISRFHSGSVLISPSISYFFTRISNNICSVINTKYFCFPGMAISKDLLSQEILSHQQKIAAYFIKTLEATLAQSRTRIINLSHSEGFAFKKFNTFWSYLNNFKSQTRSKPLGIDGLYDKLLTKLIYTIMYSLLEDYPDLIFVKSAGNERQNANQENSDVLKSRLEAYFPHVITVANCTNLRKISYFSNHGNQIVSVAALGKEVDVKVIRNGKQISLKENGTSFAAPRVCAYLAHLVSHKIEVYCMRCGKLNLKAMHLICGNFGAAKKKEFLDIMDQRPDLAHSDDLKPFVKNGRCLSFKTSEDEQEFIKLLETARDKGFFCATCRTLEFG